MTIKHKITKANHKTTKGRLECDTLVFCYECGIVRYEGKWYDYIMPKIYRNSFSSGLCPTHFDEAMQRLNDHRKIKGAFVE